MARSLQSLFLVASFETLTFLLSMGPANALRFWNQESEWSIARAVSDASSVLERGKDAWLERRNQSVSSQVQREGW